MSNYVQSVSFDTMTNKDLPNYSFTLRGKAPGYKRSRRSRIFMVATDLATHSEYALDWVNEEIMDDGDELVVLRVVTIEVNDKKVAENNLKFEEERCRETANKVMQRIMDKSCQEKKQIGVVIEFVVGKVQETIQETIAMYQPSLLIVGTRGYSGIKNMLLGSVSKYCLQHSPVPVTVVRPDSSRKQSKSKKNRLSGLFRMSNSSSVPTITPVGTTGSSSGDDDPELNTTYQKLKRMSVFDKLGQQSSSSPANTQ